MKPQSLERVMSIGHVDRAIQTALLLVTTAIALVVGSNQCMGQPTYSLKDLGVVIDLPGRSDGGPASINSSGSVAGANAIGGAYHAMMYNGTWNDLGTLGGDQSLAAAIDDVGRVVGYSQTDTGTTNAFLWTPGGTGGVAANPQMKSLGTLSGAVSEAFAINTSGQITGYSDVSGRASLQQHAFLYSAGVLSDLGLGMAQLVNSFGYAINAAGHVAGTAYDTSYTIPHAFFFDGLAATDLGTFGGLGASVQALNNSDTLVGYLTTTSSTDHAFSYSGGSLTDLGTLGGNYSYALSINNSNAVVGGSFADAKNSIYHAFSWANGVMVDLNNLLDPSGAGWNLTEARAINDIGQIAGVGTLNGVNHAFLLTPALSVNPTPSLSVFQTNGPRLVISFSTVASKQYVLQTNSALKNAGWGNASAILSGTGGALTLIDAMPKAPHLFYRLKSF